MCRKVVDGTTATVQTVGKDDKNEKVLGTVAHAFNPSAWEAGAVGSL